MTETETRAETAAQEIAAEAISVEIYDQVYRLRGTDPAYIEQLAAMVDEKMRAVSAHGATVDTLRVAVLASLNIADELLRLQQRYDASVDQVQQGLLTRAGSLAGLLDEVLEERKAG